MPLPYPTNSEDIAPLGRAMDERGNGPDVQAVPRARTNIVDTVTGWPCPNPAVPFVLRPADQTDDPVGEYVARLRARPKLAAATADTQVVVRTGADGGKSDVDNVHMLVLCAHSAALRAAVYRERPAGGAQAQQTQCGVDVKRHATADRLHYTLTMPSGMPVDAVRKVIDYMYTREVTVSAAGCDALLAVANYLRMAELVDSIADYMTQVAGHSEQWAKRLGALCIKHRLPMDTADAIQYTISKFEQAGRRGTNKVDEPPATSAQTPPPEPQPQQQQEAGQSDAGGAAGPSAERRGDELVSAAFGSQYDMGDMI